MMKKAEAVSRSYSDSKNRENGRSSLSWTERIGFGAGFSGTFFAFFIVGSYLTMYMTNVALLDIAAVILHSSGTTRGVQKPVRKDGRLTDIKLRSLSENGSVIGLGSARNVFAIPEELENKPRYENLFAREDI